MDAQAVGRENNGEDVSEVHDCVAQRIKMFALRFAFI